MKIVGLVGKAKKTKRKVFVADAKIGKAYRKEAQRMENKENT